MGEVQSAASPNKIGADKFYSIMPTVTTGRFWLIIGFWVWGLIGLIGGVIGYLNLPSVVGVGTSGLFLVGEMLWIGGMVLFGLGGLLLPPKSLPNRVSLGSQEITIEPVKGIHDY